MLNFGSTFGSNFWKFRGKFGNTLGLERKLWLLIGSTFWERFLGAILGAIYENLGKNLGNLVLLGAIQNHFGSPIGAFSGQEAVCKLGKFGLWEHFGL